MIETSIESQVAALRHDLDQLREQIATEVRTRRLVVAAADSFEAITAEAHDLYATFEVSCRSTGTDDTTDVSISATSEDETAAA